MSSPSAEDIYHDESPEAARKLLLELSPLRVITTLSSTLAI
jgi:hypothetical protein